MSPPPLLKLRHPEVVLWRADGVLQIGLSHPLVLERVPPATADLVELLRAGHSRGDLVTRLPQLTPAWIDWVCDQLGRGGLLATAPSGSDAAVDTPPVAVWGAGPLARRITAQLAATGVASTRLTPEGVGSLDPRRLVVVADAHAEPDRVLTTQLSRAAAPHLIVRLEPARAVVGPLVVPGRSSCVRCNDLYLCAHDNAWPRLLVQLCSQRTEPAPVLLEWAATTAVTQVEAWKAGLRADAQARTLELSLAELRLRARAIPAHPECGCLS